MADPEEELFNSELCARVKRLREEKGWSSERMAMVLRIPAFRYQKYEYRSPLPQYLIERFASIVDRSVEYVLTGKDSRSRAVPKRQQQPIEGRLKA